MLLQRESGWAIWVLAGSNREILHQVNEYGDLTEKVTTSKLMLGNLLRVWTSSTTTLLKREGVFDWYANHGEEVDVEKECRVVNWANRWSLPK